MRVLIHDTLATLFFAKPALNGWAASTDEFDVRPALTGKEVGPGDAALLPSAEIARLAESHFVLPDVAVVFEGEGPIAIRTPARPDEVDHAEVALNGVSGTAEILARATLEPFYGIRVTGYEPESADARISLLEGIETLLPVEGGFQESLVRAWFILTGQPVVSHLLVAPRNWSPDETNRLAATMTSLREAGHARRSELRAAVASDAGIEREQVVSLFAKVRYALDEPDRRALLMLLQRGNKGSDYPYPWSVDYFAAEPASE